MGLLNWLRKLIGHDGSDAEDDRGADVEEMMGWADSSPGDPHVSPGDARRTATSAGEASTGAATAATDAATAATDADTAGTEQVRPRPEYECAVCGTGVYTPDEQCPLCHSRDVVPVDGPDAAGERGGSDQADDQGVPSFGDQHVSEADDDSVEKLRELRERQGLLERHADRWRPTAGGFRVETTDGERTVDSREALVAALESHEEEAREDEESQERDESQADDDQVEDAHEENRVADDQVGEAADDQVGEAADDSGATRNSGTDRNREDDGE